MKVGTKAAMTQQSNRHVRVKIQHLVPMLHFVDDVILDDVRVCVAHLLLMHISIAL